MLNAALVVTVACVASVSVGGISVHAQAARDGSAVVEPEASTDRVPFMKLNVNVDPFTLRPANDASPAARIERRSSRLVQPPASRRPEARARSKKRIVAGAIVASVGGFFAGGFLGAHIEGDRCDCDDPGVRGFLIGAPIGAIAGGILGAKFLF